LSKGPEQLTLNQWEARYRELKTSGFREPHYGGPLSRHVEDGDLRLLRIRFDNSPAALSLWNFLLTEEERLAAARQAGKKLVGTMKDLGTVPVLAYSFEDIVAFYPDGAWWIPCVMELSAGLLGIADSMGIDESFCPVRAMLGAFVTQAHFPIPDLLVCSVGAVCDDFSAIAQRLAGLGHPIMWWEMPHRRKADTWEEEIRLSGGFTAPTCQVSLVRSELDRIKKALENLSGKRLNDKALSEGIAAANEIRERMDDLRYKVFTAKICPMPALEMLIVEMLAIHYCSDRRETLNVIDDLLEEVERRIGEGVGYFGEEAPRIFWVNPVADLVAMNLLEKSGGRICGTEYLFSHALDTIPTDVSPMEALARTALADPMVGSTKDRADRIVRDIKRFGSEAVIISKIPGASHCAQEGEVIAEVVKSTCEIPVLEIEVPPMSDSLRPSLTARMDALIETVRENRRAVGGYGRQGNS
jgi:benzoyl-CoA reductase/2-hydroxyglutaryl-CoA dehydratase subunit BcrC/BadD/HgdB